MRWPIRSRRALRRRKRDTPQRPQTFARGRVAQLAGDKQTLMPIGCLRFRLRRSQLTARAAAHRLRAKLLLYTVFKFVAIMRHSAALGKDNAAAVRAARRAAQDGGRARKKKNPAHGRVFSLAAGAV
jgi:hypothetical protein